MLSVPSVLQLDDGTRVPIELVWIERTAQARADCCFLCFRAGDQNQKRELAVAEAERLRDLLKSGGTFDERLNKLD